MSDYLLYGTLPPEGTVCNQDWVPFSTPLTAAAAAPEAKNGRSRVTPAMVPDVVREVIYTDH